MADDKERVNWSALMDAHGIEPDADTRAPAIEPDRERVDAQRETTADPPRRGRVVHWLVAVTAVFSIAASVAVLIAIIGHDDGGGGGALAAATPGGDRMVPLGARPAAFEQTTDGVMVVPPPESAPAPEPAPPPPVADTRTAPPKKPPEQASRTAEKETPAAPAPEPPDPNAPDAPDPGAVTAAMAALEKDIAACAAPAKLSGEVGIKMRIEPDGSVAWASARVQNTPFQACLDRLFKKARMPKSQKGATVRQTVALP